MKREDFTANDHAFLFGLIAKETIESCGEEGAKAVVEGIIKYGKERGNRMALRVKKDGGDLDLVNYIAYSEWEAKEGDMDVRVHEINPDYHMEVYKCPWYEEWNKNNLMKYACLYCRYVDEAIVEGFNKSLALDVLKNRADGGECCDFWFRNVKLSKEDLDKINKKKDALDGKAIMPWDYHIGHIYKTMSQVVEEKLGYAGKKAVDKALKCFEERYGKEAINIIFSFKDIDFNII